MHLIHQDKKDFIDVLEVYSGNILLLSPTENSLKLVDRAKECLLTTFGGFPSVCDEDHAILDFINKAVIAKNEFTNSNKTKEIIEDLIYVRYANYVNYDLLYDVPRLRIIPKSTIIKTGISYNYLPHRDTWYGGSQDQINHWISVENVSKNSTFFIAPSYFNREVKNNSEIFDLDTWDKVHRGKAKDFSRVENRPHPIPTEEIPPEYKLGFAISSGQEVCFSGHHLHGSLENTTDQVRISIDFRISIPKFNDGVPRNIDNRAQGDYHKYMIKHPSFGSKN